MLDELLLMSPTEFEHAVAAYLRERGYADVRRVGVGQGAVSKWELGRVVPPAATRARLAELADGTGVGPPPERGGDEG